MYKDSVYRKMLEDNDKVLHTGYNYREKGMVNKFFSSRMFMNPIMEGFINKIEPYFTEMLDSVKKLQFYQNFTIDKNDGRLNK